MADISSIEQNISERLERAELGRLYWNELAGRYKFDEDCRIFCFPHIGDVYIQAVRDCLDDFISKYNVKRLFLLSEQEISMSTGLDCRIENVVAKKSNIDDLICLYEMGMFSASILFISTEVPNDDGKWKWLIEKCGVSLYDALKNWILNFEIIQDKQSGVVGA